MVRGTDNAFTGITGEPADGAPDNEEDHYYICGECGQAVDMRNLGEVFHHEEPGHERLRDHA